MLSKRPTSVARRKLGRRQQGVVLLITLIVLVAMTLAAIAMIRSVDTGNLIAGNLSFRQAATNSGDAGIEAAITWLAQNKSGTYLFNDHPDKGYSARSNIASGIGMPPAGTTWENYWASLPVYSVKFDAAGVPAATGSSRDKADNQVAYTIARLCILAGDPTTTSPSPECSLSVVSTSAGGSNQGAGSVGLLYTNQIYYRITARVAGLHNTTSFVQAIIAM